MEQFCGKCHLVVAPKDPDRTESDGILYHFSCYKKLLRALTREVLGRRYAQRRA